MSREVAFRFVVSDHTDLSSLNQLVMDYDKILVMDNGKAAEFGSPSQLIEADGIFKDLINATGEGASALIQIASDADREREKLASDSSFFD